MVLKNSYTKVKFAASMDLSKSIFTLKFKCLSKEVMCI